mgnify:CR=1 FL=1
MSHGVGGTAAERLTGGAGAGAGGDGGRRETNLFRQKMHLLLNKANHLLALATIILRVAPSHTIPISLLDLRNDRVELCSKLRRRTITLLITVTTSSSCSFLGLMDPAAQRGENQLSLLEQMRVHKRLEALRRVQERRQHAELGSEELHFLVVLHHQLLVGVLL